MYSSFSFQQKNCLKKKKCSLINFLILKGIFVFIVDRTCDMDLTSNMGSANHGIKSWSWCFLETLIFKSGVVRIQTPPIPHRAPAVIINFVS